MSIKLGYPINAKSQRFLQNVTFWIRTRTEMTILNVIEKRQKSPFLPSALLQKSSLQKPKACHRSQWNSVLVQAWKWLFCSYSFPWPKPLVQCILTLPRFSTSRLHCALRKSQNFWRRSFLPPFFFFIFMQILRPSTEISRLLWFSLVANSKIWSVWARNSLVVESQSYFVSERPF